MTAEECLEVLETCGYKRNGMGGISGRSKGVDFTVCEHMFKGICIMGHSFSKDRRLMSDIEEYVNPKNFNKVSFAGWFCSIIEKYSHQE